MALTDAQWSAAQVEINAKLIAGTITEQQAIAQLTTATEDWPTRTLSNADLAARVSRFLARLNGLIITDGPPDVALGELNTFAYDARNGALYGPKTAAAGWGRPVSLVGPQGLSAKQIVINAGLLPGGATDADFATWLADAQIDKVQPLVDAAEAARDDAQQALTDTEALADQIVEDSTPDITVTAVAGAPGTPASVVKGGTLKAPTFEVTVPRGADGEEVGLRANATHVQWRLGDGAWTDLVALADLAGADGREVQLQASATHIQWRYVGDTAWTNVVALSALTGPQGNAAWSPIYANVADGARRVQRVVDWTGGQGTKPATGKYLGPSGLVDTAAEATDIRGASGAGTGDMLGSNNLNDVTDKATSRQNLSVWSRAEIGPVDADYLSLIDSADPAGLSFAPTGINFAKNTGRLDYVDAASAAAVPGLTYTRTGAATAWRKDGTLATFAPNVPRITDAGVTIEGQRTNLLLNSALAGGATVTGWSSWASPTHSDSPSTVLGTVRARSFSVTNSRDVITATGSEVNMAPGVQYCLSVTVESISAGIPAREILHHGFTPSDVSLSYPVCPANPSGGAMGIVQPGRLHILVTSATGGSAKQWRIGLGAIANVTGTARLSLPQLEQASTPSTPIITTGAAATVGADNLALVLPAGVKTYRAEYNGNQVAQGVAAPGAFDLVSGRPWLNGTLQRITFS